MSASLFHWEWFTDPPWDRVSLWWLVNYVDRVRANPREVEKMRANEAEFEMVPVPVSVIRHLAAATGVDKGQLPKAPAVDRGPVAEVVNKFAEALQKGDAKGALANVARSYFDVNGRDRKALQRDLTTMVQELPGLQVKAVKPNEVEPVGNQVVATLTAEWKADRGGGRTKIEVFVGRTGAGAWQIESIRAL
jgi:hypothetical protein